MIFLSGLALPLWLCRGGDLCGLYSALSQDVKLVVENVPLVVTLLVIYEHLNILAMFYYYLHPAQPEEDWPTLIAWFLSRFLPRFWPF